MLHSPNKPIEINQTSVIGPKNFPIVAVPCRCTTKSAVKIPRPIGISHLSNAGVAMLKPSIAESTEIAGVMIPSPKNSEAPTKPKAMRHIF